VAKEKDTRVILQNVVFHDRTYGPGDEDALEERLTKENYERIMRDDPPPLAGNWSPQGKDEAPMQRSRVAVGERRGTGGAFGPHPSQPNKPHPAEGEAARLKAENDKLKAELEKHQAGEARAAQHAAKAHDKRVS
jgi:hypothetical protein